MEEDLDTIKIQNAVLIDPHWWKPWHTMFYVDTPKILSLDVFNKHEIIPWGFRRMDSPGDDYVGVLCRIRKSNITAFFECMDELRRLLLISGHNDYDSICEKIISGVFE